MGFMLNLKFIKTFHCELFKKYYGVHKGRVVDPDSFNTDPDPAFLLNPDPDPS
jgi:hypothetical protein